MNLTTLFQRRRSWPTPQPPKARLRVEALEERTLLAVNLVPPGAFPGLSFSNDPRYWPPDTDVAAGMCEIVETINSSIAYYNKATGTQIAGSLQTLQRFFAPIGPGNFIDDPVVTYLDQVNRFVVAAMDNPSTGGSFVDVAISNSDGAGECSPAFTQMYRINVGVGTAFGDNPKIGWNADDVVISMSMFGAGAPYVKALVIGINSILLGPLQSWQVNVPGTAATDFTAAPATMHGSSVGDPMRLVQRGPRNMDGSYNTINVIEMNHVVGTGIFTFATFPPVMLPAPYYDPSPATQPAPGGPIGTTDSRILNAAFLDTTTIQRRGRLVFAHTIAPIAPAPGVLPEVEWFEFGTTAAGVPPTLTQSGRIDGGGCASTYFPAIEINPVGDLGLTYLQSSADDVCPPGEFMSMYVTGQSAAGWPGSMSIPVLAHPGSAIYTGSRAGDYGGISVDPADPNGCFWAGHMFVATAVWDTGIAHFCVTPDPGPLGAWVSHGAAEGSLPWDAASPVLWSADTAGPEPSHVQLCTHHDSENIEEVRLSKARERLDTLFAETFLFAADMPAEPGATM
jgi:hypothetical protein